MKPRNKDAHRSTSSSSQQRSRRRALTAYILVGTIAVLLTVLLLLLPGPETETPELGDGRQAEEGRPEGQGRPEKARPEAGPPAVTEPGAEERAPADDEERGAPVLYLVIDDVGYDRSLLPPFLSLPIPVTFAVLPELPDSGACAETISRSGQEYILHQPMEAVGGENPGPGVIKSTMEPKRIREVVNKNLKGLPEAKGVNNHMGSKGTAQPKVMRPLLEEIGERRLYFLDSRTTASSVGEEEARRAGVPFSARNVFLDNEESREYIEGALGEAWEIAAERGAAVMIGHIWSEELPAALREWIPEVRERGGEFRFLSSRFDEE